MKKRIFKVWAAEYLIRWAKDYFLLCGVPMNIEQNKISKDKAYKITVEEINEKK